MKPPMTPPSQVIPAARKFPSFSEWKKESKMPAEKYMMTNETASSPSDFRITRVGSFSAYFRSRKPVRKQAMTPIATISP